ncbi:Cytochrome P450 monooxygenase [Lachnellula subtilissima]|uniref:Cytochrome P450 monooxygenase n=1 Tax=Lachnellula subtilissima TaxID=602034 RepID=A0A8H8RF61_9HELO|nr:Cytochrome P450 monooxygenase [Lachnellula subtilissima]
MAIFKHLSVDLSSKYVLASALFALCILYPLGVSIHRLCFSRYAKFPGPKLAALTYGYMLYYDVFAGDGQYMYKIKDLHKEYSKRNHSPFISALSARSNIYSVDSDSPVIRISPHELHVIDPDFYDVLFAGTHTKRDKPPTWSQALSNHESMFGTISHEQHRVRRNAVSAFFSPGSLRRLEPLIEDCISRLIAVFRQCQKTGEVIEMKPAFGAMTSDIIAEYCFGTTENYIEAPGFNAVVIESTEAMTDNIHITVQAQWLPQLLDRLPEILVAKVFGSGMTKLSEMKHHCIKKIQETIKSRGNFKDVKYRTIFHDLLDSPILPESDKSVDRLWQEAQLLMAAGTVTTATSIASALVYLLLDPKRMSVLLDELETAMPDITKPKNGTELAQLPYLSAVVHEVLRLVTGVSYRLARSAPHESLQVGEWTIPPNTAVSMHAPLIHHSPDVYPEPWSFIPERWLPTPTPAGLPERPAHIPAGNHKYLVPLSKGTRQCLGQPLAYAEVHMTIAYILRTFVRVEKDGNGEALPRDTDLKRELGLPQPEKGRGTMRMIIE